MTDREKPVRGGILGGRNWHYRGRWKGSHYETLCGRRFEGRWHPGYRNLHPKTCQKCEGTMREIDA